MNKKMLMSVPLLVAGMALTACGSESSGVESVEPQSAEKLQELLLSVEESGLEDATPANDTVLTGEPIPLVVIAGSDQIEGECGTALQAAENADLPAFGSAARAYEMGDGTAVAVAQFSVEESNSDSPAELYNDIAEACTEPVNQDETGVEYEFSKLASDADGFVFDITVTPGNEASSVLMLKDLGNHHIIVAGRDSDEDTVRQVFDAQVEKTESGLAAVE